MSPKAPTTASAAAGVVGVATVRIADERHPAEGRREGGSSRRRRLGCARLRAQLPLPAEARRGGDLRACRRAPEARVAAGPARGEVGRRGTGDRGEARDDGAALRDEGGPDWLALRLRDADGYRRRALVDEQDPGRP